MRFVDENGIIHELTRIRQNNDMSIYYDGHTIRQLDLTDLFGERDVFLSILNPLYFIEELGTNGKNLLERYLPFIPQETILAQLPGAVQASLKDEVILSPDAYLKGRRAGIRELEERITYLSGQKDLAATQKKQHETMRVEISEGITALQNEIAALAEKQFAGLDTAEMQERLVELSQRYDEMARDERGDTVQQQKELRALREKSSADNPSSISPSLPSRWRRSRPRSMTWARGISGRPWYTRHFMPVWTAPPVIAA